MIVLTTLALLLRDPWWHLRFLGALGSVDLGRPRLSDDEQVSDSELRMEAMEPFRLDDDESSSSRGEPWSVSSGGGGEEITFCRGGRL